MINYLGYKDIRQKVRKRVIDKILYILKICIILLNIIIFNVIDYIDCEQLCLKNEFVILKYNELCRDRFYVFGN